MQITLNGITAAEALGLAVAGRQKTADMIAYADSAVKPAQVGAWWLAAAQYIAAPAKGGAQVAPRSVSGIKPETLALGALVAVAAYLTLS